MTNTKLEREGLTMDGREGWPRRTEAKDGGQGQLRHIIKVAADMQNNFTGSL